MNAGGDPSLLEDFVQPTYELLRSTMANIGTPYAEASLLEAFNDEELQAGLITHLRVSHLLFDTRRC